MVSSEDTNVSDQERALAAMQAMALVVLLDRAGGSIEVSRSEYEAALDRHGGSSMMAIHSEALGPKVGSTPDTIRVSLIRKPAGQGELPV